MYIHVCNNSTSFSAVLLNFEESAQKWRVQSKSSLRPVTLLYTRVNEIWTSSRALLHALLCTWIRSYVFLQIDERDPHAHRSVFSRFAHEPTRKPTPQKTPPAFVATLTKPSPRPVLLALYILLHRFCMHVYILGYINVYRSCYPIYHTAHTAILFWPSFSVHPSSPFPSSTTLTLSVRPSMVPNLHPTSSVSLNSTGNRVNSLQDIRASHIFAFLRISLTFLSLFYLNNTKCLSEIALAIFTLLYFHSSITKIFMFVLLFSKK